MIKELILLIGSFLFVYVLIPFFIDRLKQSNIVGIDVNKEDKPIVAEMGGLVVLIALIFISFFLIFLQTFNILSFNLNLLTTLAIISSLSLLGLIGIVDDLINLPQYVKALIPMFASIPLIALKLVNSTVVFIPFIGSVDLGLFYIFIVLPLSLTVAPNLTNMLAGWNGLEYGMSIPIYFFSSLLGYYFMKPHLLYFSLIMLGASIAFYIFNSYKARIFPGDVGTFLIGGLITILLIVDNMESYAIIFIPYIFEFILKALNKFPNGQEYGNYFTLKDGKIFVKGKKISLISYVVDLFNGLSEKYIALIFMFIEFVFSFFAYVLFMFK